MNRVHISSLKSQDTIRIENLLELPYGWRDAPLLPAQQEARNEAAAVNRVIHDTITPTILNRGNTAIEILRPKRLWRAREVQPYTNAGLVVNSRLCLARSRDFVRSDWHQLDYSLRKNFSTASMDHAVGAIILD